MNLENYSNFKKNYNKKILAIDYGTKVTGLAQFTPGKDPYPLTFGKIIYKNDNQLIKSIIRITEDEFFNLIILGIPHFTDGKESDTTKKIKAFGENLRSNLGKILVDVVFQDETLSTYEAKDRMKNSPEFNFKIDLKKIDMLAAVIILEDYIQKE